MKEMAKQIEQKANNIINFLTQYPNGETTATACIVKEILLKQDAKLMAGGNLYRIIAKAIGAGVYLLSLKKCD